MGKRELERTLVEHRALIKLGAALRDANDAHEILLGLNWQKATDEQREVLAELHTAGGALQRATNVVTNRIHKKVGIE